ncbi:MAG TPA: multicopper oxidase domain-containing protein, partial [Bacteroidia bacterium]|nr:multicopper oxidase domain-containing protein [Bacteroidia bacterium]
MATHERTIVASVPMAGVNLGGGVTAINAETYDGDIPGPLIVLEKGDTLIVRLINDLPHPVGIHWHGIELQNYSDGTEITQNEVPGAPLQTLNDGTPAGGTFLYKFTVPNEGLFWYHTHHHHSTNAVFRGLYGMIIVTDPAVEGPLVGTVLPSAANTRQLVLSDITVCHMAGMNTAPTYTDPTTVFPVADRQEWMSPGATAQTGPTPLQLCETEPLNEHGHTGGPVSGEGVIPNVFRMDPPMPLVPLTVEGQTVLVNGRIVRGRKGMPLDPQLLDAAGDAPIPAAPGQGFRFQILNAATTRYFRLILTDTDGNQIP